MTKTDIEELLPLYKSCPELRNTRILITGATGIIGSNLALFFQSLNIGIQLTLPVRNKNKAMEMFKDNYNGLTIVECDLMTYFKSLESHYDYIIHCACPTSGQYMSQFPVETYTLAYQSTLGILEYAKRNKVSGIVYVSSIEYYGQVDSETKITEDFQGYIDMTSSRSSYPMGKRAAEFLCVAFAKEFNVPVRIARPTQTFGSSVSSSDNRVFNQFARSIINNEDIVLHTLGESAKPYCFLTDCIDALLCILLRGENGEAYNIANDETYISIFDLAHFLREKFNPQVNVRIEQHPEMGYAPVTKLKLSSRKLQQLGWSPKYGLYEMFDKLINYMRAEN